VATAASLAKLAVSSLRSIRAAAMGKKQEKAAKQAAFEMSKELDSEMTEEERERKLKSGMGVGGGLNTGEDELFGEHSAGMWL
jgi:hypothetical protein